MSYNLFSEDSFLTRGLTRIGELFIVSVLWFLTSLPIVTIGTSTSALYYVTCKCIRRKRGSLVKEYFKSWKQNFIKGTILTIILLACVFFLYCWIASLGTTIEDIVDKGVQSAFAENSEKAVGMYIVCIIVLSLVGMLFCYMFPILSRFDISVFQIAVHAFVLALRCLHHSISVLVILVGLGYLVSRVPPVIMFAPGVWALLSSFLIEKSMKKILPDPEEGQDAWWVGL